MPVQKTDEDGVIEEALHLLRRKGYQHTTMNDVGKACGLLKGSLYHYFSSKEDMAQAVLRHVDGFFQDNVFPLGMDQNLDPSQRLEAMANSTIDYFIDRKDGCLMGNIALEALNTTPVFRPIIQRYFDDWIRSYACIYQDLGFSKQEARIKAQQAVASIQGALMMVRIFDDPSFLKQVMCNLSPPNS